MSLIVNENEFSDNDINEVQKVIVKVAEQLTPTIAPVVAQKAVKDMTAEEVENELASKELEIKRLELLERQANLEDLQERLAERQLKRKSRDSVFRGHGANLKQDTINRKAKQEICNHRKGGDGAQGVIGGQGDDTQYAIMRHIMGNGDTWVRCLRCGKTWKYPVASQYTNKQDFQEAYAEYQAALKFPTRNHTSGTHTFSWGVVQNAKGKLEGGPEFYRERTKQVTLD
jgi:hypothetical protein